MRQSRLEDIKPENGSARLADPLTKAPLASAASNSARVAVAVAVRANPNSAALEGMDQEVKPSRGKAIITGRPRNGSQPKVAPQGLAGVLELLFEIEPGSNLPKGLPALEKTLIKVWVTDKQYNKLKDILTPASRFLIEGEIGAGINSQNFEPFIRVVCTRLTTLELEQAAKQKKAAAAE